VSEVIADFTWIDINLRLTVDKSAAFGVRDCRSTVFMKVAGVRAP